MNGTEAIAELLKHVGDEPIVHANGFISRASFNVQDRLGNFYMIGSMGLASSIGLGVALAKPDRRVLVLDGDGNVLMAMGTLAMIAAAAPKNLLHIVIDNEVYESTGNQSTLSKQIALEEIARAAGYAAVRKAVRREDIGPAYKELLAAKSGPGFLLIKAKPGFDPSTGRVTHTPEEIRDRFMAGVAGKRA